MTRGSRGSRVGLLVACALAALGALFWAPWIVRGRVPAPAGQQTWMLPWSASDWPLEQVAQWDALWWDGVAQFYPWRLQLHRWLGRGEWPLWSQSQFCGYPFVGNGQSAMLYPPNWLYAILHPRTGLAVLSAIHSILALLLTFAYCRIVGLPRAGAAYAGIAFAFGGFMLGWTPLPTLVNCAAWLPGCLLGVELVMRGLRGVGVAVLATCVGMTVLAGHAQIATYVLLTAGVYAFARIAYAAFTRRPAPIWQLLAAAGLGLGLAAAQALPMVELGGLSPRGGGVATEDGFEHFHLPRALKPWELKTLAWPDALGNPARGDYRAPERTPWAAYGERCGYVGLLTLALGALGLACGRRRLRWAIFAAAGIALWGAMGGLPAEVLYYCVPKLGLTGGFARLLCVYTFFAAVLGGMGLEAVAARADRRDACPTRADRRDACPTRALHVAALAVLVAELFAWGWRTLPAPPQERLYAATAVTDYLQDNRRPGERMLAVTRRTDWSLAARPDAVLPPNSATAYDGLESIQGYDSLAPKSCWEFGSLLESGGGAPAGEMVKPSPLVNGNMVLLENTESPLLDLAGVRWIVTAAEGEGARDEREVEVEGVRIRRNEGAFPRAFLTSKRIGGGTEALDALARLPENERRAVHGDFGEHCNLLTLDLPPRRAPTNLVVTNTFYPGWRAWAGGEPVTVAPAAETFQAMELPSGPACPLLLVFLPATVVIGMFLGLLAAGTIVGVLVFESRGEREGIGRIGPGNSAANSAAL